MKLTSFVFSLGACDAFSSNLNHKKWFRITLCNSPVIFFLYFIYKGYLFIYLFAFCVQCGSMIIGAPLCDLGNFINLFGIFSSRIKELNQAYCLCNFWFKTFVILLDDMILPDKWLNLKWLLSLKKKRSLQIFLSKDTKWDKI